MSDIVVTANPQIVKVDVPESPQVTVDDNVVNVAVPDQTVEATISGDGAVGVLVSYGTIRDSHYRHVQAIASNVWVIVHNLGKHPSVQVSDSTKRQVEVDIEWTDLNTVTIRSVAPFAGEAFLN